MPVPKILVFKILPLNHNVKNSFLLKLTEISYYFFIHKNVCKRMPISLVNDRHPFLLPIRRPFSFMKILILVLNLK